MYRSLDEWYAPLLATAAKHGGKVITPKSEFLHARPTTTVFECKKGHQREATADSILHRKSWCPKCHFGWLKERIYSGIYKPPIKRPDLEKFKLMKETAINHGGQLLDSDYVGIRKKYWWRCREGHEWQAFGGDILHRNSWCRKCHIAKMTRKP
jgi:hypothetical protein